MPYGAAIIFWRLSLIKATNVNKTVKYESDLDTAKGTESAIVFVLGAITTRLLLILTDRNMEQIPVVGEDGKPDFVRKMNEASMIYDTVKFGLRDVINADKITDEEGKSLKFETEYVSVNGGKFVAVKDSFLSALPFELITELAIQINNINTVLEEERKN